VEKLKELFKNKKFLAGFIAAVIVIVLIIVLVVVNSGKEEEVVEEEPEEVVEEVEEEDTGFYSRLTGLSVDEDMVDTRPVAIMIENTSMALPQYGLNSAGVIYECPVEGGITRLMALFEDYSGLEKIGNVRSCRPYYVYISAEFDAIYVHYGQSTQGEDALNKGLVDELNGLDGIGSVVFFRSDDKEAPHNAYTSESGLNAGLESEGISRTYSEDYTSHYVFASEENTLEDGEDCKAFSLYFSNNKPYFVYDEETQTYLRYEFSQAQIDALDGNQVAVKNVILQYVPSTLYDEGPYLDITLNGTGEGKYITDGKMIDITWSKDSDAAVTHYYTADGEELEINPGTTWVSLIENSSVEKNAFYATQDELLNQ